MRTTRQRAELRFHALPLVYIYPSQASRTWIVLPVIPKQESHVDGARPEGGAGIGDEVRRNDEKQRDKSHFFTRDQPMPKLDADPCVGQQSA